MSAESQKKASVSDYLAAERTLLAWIRTGLALMGFGFVVARFGLFLQRLLIMESNVQDQSYGLSLWFGTALIVAGILVNAFGGWHHIRLVRQLDSGEPSYSRASLHAVAIAFFLALAGLVMAIYLISVRKPAHLQSAPVHSLLRFDGCEFGGHTAARGAQCKCEIHSQTVRKEEQNASNRCLGQESVKTLRL